MRPGPVSRLGEVYLEPIRSEEEGVVVVGVEGAPPMLLPLYREGWRRNPP